MRNTPQWFNQLRNKFNHSLNELTKNAKNMTNNIDTKNIKSTVNKTFNSTSQQLRKSMNQQYQNLPQYKSQIKSGFDKAAKQTSELNTQFQQKFREVSSSNPTLNKYTSKAQNTYNNVSEKIPNINVQESINSTLKSSKKLASNVQSTAKQLKS